MIVCGDINDGPGLDASEKRLFGSGVERLMGTVWKPQLCLRNALFESLDEGEQAVLDFTSIATASFQDPIFNSTWHQEWIDHVLYTDDNQDEGWVSSAQVHRYMPDGSPLWDKYEHASRPLPGLRDRSHVDLAHERRRSRALLRRSGPSNRRGDLM